MLEVAIMIEGQNGLNWPRWQQIVRAVEQLGFAGLYRSDHFTNAGPPDSDSLELWTSLTWLAANTSRIEFGPLVTPFSFRHPALTARMAAAVDDLSQGRLTLGLGAGWQEREHGMYGFDLLEPGPRFDRFEEGLECVTGLLGSEQPVTFEGKYFQLRGASLFPRPGRRGGPPILIGGNGYRRTLPLAARFGAEWNANFLEPGAFERANRRFDELLERAGRAPGSVRRSMMTGCVFARTEAALMKKIAARGRPAEELRKRGVIVGTGGAVQEALQALEDSGVQRVMLQWLDLDDLDGLAGLAELLAA
jgi:F420-dependent oxidoreductase-like protein